MARYQWKTVESSHVLAVCWKRDVDYTIRLKDGSTRHVGTMYVAFHQGDVYMYESIPRGVYLTILQAKSVGNALYHLLTKKDKGRRVGKLNQEKGVHGISTD